MFVPLSKGVNCWFWYQVRCSIGNANFIFHTGIVIKGCLWRNNKGRNQLERIKTLLPYALGKKSPQQVFLFIISQTQIWIPMETSVFLSELSNHVFACIQIYDLKMLTAIRCYCTKYCQHYCRPCLLVEKNNRFNFCTDSLRCPDDYQCGNNSICVVDALFPKTPVCKCLKGHKMSSEGKCEGML